MSETSLSADFSFSGALSAAADSASLTEGAAQDDGGSVGDDGDGAGGTVLLVGAVGLAGLGVAVLAGGGGNKNEAPNITSGTTATIAENAAITTAVYTTVATDPDGDALTYSLTGTDAAAFAISSTGVVTLKAPADFEAKSSYSFNVVVSDGDLSDTQAVTVTVTDVTGAGDPPVFTSGTTASVQENSAVTTVVYDANVSGTGATFALTGSDAAAFTIDADDGEVRFVSSPDFEAKQSYTIGVVATQGGVSTTRNVTVNVTNVTEAPTFSSGTSANFAENLPTSTVAYDANVNGTAATTFSLTGADAAAFTIDANDGEVRFVSQPDFESGKTSYSIGVVATSGGESTTQNVTINITDVDPDGPVFTSGNTGSVVENSPAATTVAYDADATGAGAITFGITGANAGLFNIDSTTGVVTFKNSPDFETPPTSYTLTVTATDSGGTTTKDVTINVLDADEPDRTEVDIDVGSANSTITLDDALDGDVVFLDNFTVTTNVILKGFTEGDIIEVEGITSLNQYSYTTGTGAGGADDLVITSNNGSGITGRIVIEDAISDASVIFSTYEKAVEAVGYDFMVIA